MELPYPVRLPYVKSVNIRATDTVLKSFFSKKLKGVKNNQIIAMSYSINTMSAIKIKRIYEKSEKDEYRILVDRLWPRGLTKELAAIDLWLKEIAPSPGLRMWFKHDPKKFLEFRAHYVEELAQNPAVTILSNLLTKHKNVALVYAAKSEDINHAVVLKGVMESM